jgi:hypothetical protein
MSHFATTYGNFTFREDPEEAACLAYFLSGQKQSAPKTKAPVVPLFIEGDSFALFAETVPSEVFLEQIRELLNGISENSLTPAQIDRILYLAGESMEDDDCHNLSFSSLAGFVRFMQRFNPVAPTAVSINSYGELYALWRNGPDYKFSIEVVNHAIVRYAAFYGEHYKNDECGEKEIARMGTLFKEREIFDLVKPAGVQLG